MSDALVDGEWEIFQEEPGVDAWLGFHFDFPATDIMTHAEALAWLQDKQHAGHMCTPTCPAHGKYAKEISQHGTADSTDPRG